MAPRALTRWYCAFISAAIVAPCVIGCGSDSSSSDATDHHGTPDSGAANEGLYRSGTRLHARVYDGGDGAVRFEGWSDTKLNISCAFHRADDGKLRCVPEKSPLAEIVYLDAACTQPVGLRRCDSVAEYLAVEGSQSACDAADNPYTMYHLGATVAKVPVFNKLGANTCVPGDPMPDGAELRSLTAVPAGMFVAAIPTEQARADGLSVRVLTADDGARETVAIIDTDLHTDCTPRRDNLGLLRCAPVVTAIAGGPFFEDASCTKPLLADVSAKAGCPAPAFAADSSSGSACGESLGAIRVGPKVASSTVFQEVAGACGQAAFLPPDWAFYEKGTSIPPGSMHKLDESKLGKGRLRTPVLLSDQHLLAQGRGFVDTVRGETCVPREIGGVLRCLPDGAVQFDFFEDDQCTVPLAAVPRVPGCSTPAPKVGVIAMSPPDPMCASPMVVDRVYEIGGAWTGPTVYTRSGGTACTALDTASLPVDIYSVGAEIPATDLAQVTAETK